VAIQSTYVNIKINSKLYIYRFEHTWPAISYKLNGTIFVYNPDDKKQAEELNLWYIEKQTNIYVFNALFILLLGIIILLKNQIYQKNLVYLLLQKKINMKKEVEVVMKQDYVKIFFLY
jgi:hypothetical protein